MRRTRENDDEDADDRDRKRRRVDHPETRALELHEGLDDAPDGSETKVGGSLATLLQTCQDVIELIKTFYFPCGSGNVCESILGSCGGAKARLLAFRNICFIGQGVGEPLEVGTQQLKHLNSHLAVMQHAACAALVGGGNCLQNAALSYTLLFHLLPAGTTISIVKVTGVDHAYVVVGNPRAPANALCVDPWPHYAKACLLTDTVFRPFTVAFCFKARGTGDTTAFDEMVASLALSIDTFRGTRHTSRRDRLISRNLDKCRPRNEHEFNEGPGPEDDDYEQPTCFPDDAVPIYHLV